MNLYDGNLLQSGNFHLSSGVSSNFKIDCDALTDADIQTAAILLKERLRPFGSVEGIPRGGLRLAEAMEQYITDGPLLIVDDVLTSGKSMETARGTRYAYGAVIFSRGEIVPGWITPLFKMAVTKYAY